MNRAPLLFLGLFAAIVCSWTGFVLAPQLQLGGLSQTNTVLTASTPSQTYPLAMPGEAHAGAEVYRANGCAACHTEMVRPRTLGSDIHRHWGARRSLAQDYLLDTPVMLGGQRIGPDLANAGLRSDYYAILVRLYNPRLITPGFLMPPYRFLFDVRKTGLFPSPDALPLRGPAAPPPGYEIIPSPAARALAVYMTSLRQSGYLFEAPPPPAPATNAPAKPAATNTPAK